MNFLKAIFKGKDNPIKSYEDFWSWFIKYEKSFYNVVKNAGNIEKDFFDKIAPKLNELREGFWYLTGMYDENTVELIITADGNIENIVFVEELIGSAPAINNWKFTALKPALDIKDVSIEMSGIEFNNRTLNFYSNDNIDFPDEIDITIVHENYTEENKSIIINGVYIFLDNYLGELNFVVTIDNLNIIGRDSVEKELISIEKLKSFLNWRQKEFIEKYEGVRHNTENDGYVGLEAELENGQMLLAIVNEDLLLWDRKASHPWISVFTIKYDGSNTNGMPTLDDNEFMQQIEEEIMQELKDFDGYLNLGRETAKSERVIYFACKDFRLPSKVFLKLQKKYAEKFEFDYDILKDKYWQSLNRFMPKNF